MRQRAPLHLIAVALLAVGAHPALAQGTSEEFWPELDAYVHLTPAARLFFLAAPVYKGEEGSFTESQYGIHLDVGLAPIGPGRRQHRVDPDKLRYLRARVGYRVGTSRDADGERQVSEQRVIAELTPRAFLPLGFMAAARNRFDFRWLEGSYSWRYRPRLWLERESEIGGFSFMPYASAEIFHDSRYDSWNRTRYQVGVAVPVAKWMVPEVYYARQNDEQPSERHVNALGVVATFYF